MTKEKAEQSAAKSEEKQTPEAAQPQGQPAAPPEIEDRDAGMVPEGFTLKEENAFATRADYFAGSFAITEVLLAFGRVSRDGSREINVDAKVIMSVRDAKRVHLTLKQLIEQYEEKYGVISV